MNATVPGAGTTTFTMTNGPAASPTPSGTPFPEYDLIISQSDSPHPVPVGSSLTYTLTVSIVPSALGGSAVPDVRFNFPSGVPIVFNTAAGTNGYVATPDATGVTFSGGVIQTSGVNPGTATLTVVVTPQLVGTLVSAGGNVIVDPNDGYGEVNETDNTAQTIQTPVVSPPVTVSGKVLTSDGRGLRNATVLMTDSQNNVRPATTSSFGFFSFDNVLTGDTYTFRVQSRSFRYSPQSMLITAATTLPDFVGLE
jgi:hypothetical protein